MELEEIKEQVKNVLSEKRFYHSVCTMNQCEILAKHYGLDLDTARKVGIAHDVAKEMPTDEKLEYARTHNLSVNDVEKSSPTLLHAKIGADICRKKFNFSQEMVQAVYQHTTGGLNMSLLAKILFIADGTGDDRNWEDLEYVRNLSMDNIDKAILYMLDFTIKECLNKNSLIHLDTIICRNELMKKNLK